VVLFGVSIWLLVMLVADLAILMWCTETDSPFIGLFTVAVSAALARWVFGIPIISWVMANPLLLAGCAALYFVTGVAWTYPKWWFFVRNIRDRYLDHMRSWLRGKGVEDWDSAMSVPNELKNQWFNNRHNAEWLRMFPVRARNYKSKIMTWMAWWPASMVWTLINDPIRKIYRYAWEVLRSTFDRVANSAMSGVEIPTDSSDDVR